MFASECHWLPGFTEVLTKPGVKGEATRPVHCDGNKLSHSVFLSVTYTHSLPNSSHLIWKCKMHKQCIGSQTPPPPFLFLPSSLCHCLFVSHSDMNNEQTKMPATRFTQPWHLARRLEASSTGFHCSAVGIWHRIWYDCGMMSENRSY